MTNGIDCAYPADSHTQTEGGLTKREYFAVMAMQGLLSQHQKHEEKNGFSPVYPAVKTPDMEELTLCATELADLLISALNTEIIE